MTDRNDRKIQWIAICGLACGILALGLVLAAPKINEVRAERRCGQRHVLPVSEKLAFLPDEFALTKALEAVALQGFDTNNWKPEFYSQTKAPDGTNDRFLCRNLVNDNQGIIKLTNAVGKYRYVQVSYHTNSVECVVRGVRSPTS